jgi:diacylglycerol O-acyltransferase
MRTYLLERDDLPDDPLVAMVPVSVRTEAQQGTFGNRVSALTAPIPTDEPDPRRRLQRTHEVLKSAKERHKALPADMMMDATAFIPPTLSSRALRMTMQAMGRTRPPLNLVISNVPGSRRPLFSAGARLEAHYPVSVVVDGVGLNITVMSYLDHLDFGIVADRDQVDDVWQLLDLHATALGELEEAVLGRREGVREARVMPSQELSGAPS